MRFFFYGTLIDPDVRRAVLGRRPLKVEKARLADWRCVTIPGRTYTTIVPARGAQVDGLLVRGLDVAAQHRLRRYETDEYDLIEAEVVTETGKRRRARVFVAPVPLAGPAWTYTGWLRRHKRRWMAAFARVKAAHTANFA